MESFLVGIKVFQGNKKPCLGIGEQGLRENFRMENLLLRKPALPGKIALANTANSQITKNIPFRGMTQCGHGDSSCQETWFAP
jgi:hypothetical protein